MPSGSMANFTSKLEAWKTSQTAVINSSFHTSTMEAAGSHLTAAGYRLLGNASYKPTSCEADGFQSIFDPNLCQFAANLLQRGGLVPRVAECKGSPAPAPIGCSTANDTWALTWGAQGACKNVGYADCSPTRPCICHADGRESGPDKKIGYVLVTSGKNCGDHDNLKSADECTAAGALMALGNGSNSQVWVASTDDCSIYPCLCMIPSVAPPIPPGLAPLPPPPLPPPSPPPPSPPPIPSTPPMAPPSTPPVAPPSTPPMAPPSTPPVAQPSPSTPPMAPPSLPQPSPPPLLPPLSYRGFPNAFTYNEAREHCALDGGIISVPHSEEERLAIMAARTADNYTWVGYTLPKNKDIRTKYDKYVGEDGAASVAAFNYWHHNEPSGAKRNWARGVWMEPGTGRWWMGCFECKSLRKNGCNGVVGSSKGGCFKDNWRIMQVVCQYGSRPPRTQPTSPPQPAWPPEPPLPPQSPPQQPASPPHLPPPPSAPVAVVAEVEDILDSIEQQASDKAAVIGLVSDAAALLNEARLPAATDGGGTAEREQRTALRSQLMSSLVAILDTIALEPPAISNGTGAPADDALSEAEAGGVVLGALTPALELLQESTEVSVAAATAGMSLATKAIAVEQQRHVGMQDAAATAACGTCQLSLDVLSASHTASREVGSGVQRLIDEQLASVVLESLGPDATLSAEAIQLRIAPVDAARTP